MSISILYLHGYCQMNDGDQISMRNKRKKEVWYGNADAADRGDDIETPHVVLKGHLIQRESS
jgi:hypothetical protein